MALSGTLELVCLKFEKNPSSVCENEQVTTIIHGYKMDCDALVHHCDIKLTTAHDTSTFHEVLTGSGSVGLNDLLERHSTSLNLHRDSNVYYYNYQFWDQRSLTDFMQKSHW
jgi:ribonuclease D